VKIAAAHAARAVGDGFAEPCALELELIILTAGVTQDTALNASTKCVSPRLSPFSPSLSSGRLPHRASVRARRPPLTRARRTMNVPRKFVTCGLLDHPFPGLEGVAPLEERRLLRRLDGADMLAMFQLAADKGLRRWWVSLIPMEDVTIALQNVKDKQVRYPYLLTADIYGPPGLDAAEAAAEEKKLFQSAQEAVG
jgi:hypothetical protein